MLGRILLLLIQLGVGFYVTPKIMQHIEVDLGDFQIFLYALVVAIVIWALGVIGALVLKDVARPSPSTLAFAILVALIFAGLTLVPEVKNAVASVVKGLPDVAYPLLGAVLGYAVKR